MSLGISKSDSVLALDTATAGIALALYNGTQERFYTRQAEMSRGQAESLMPMIEDLVARGGMALTNLGAVVTTIGPGTFTGLRIGMSAARALALALDVPLYGITTLQALAMECAARKNPHGAFAVVVETRRDDFYVQIFDPKAEPLSQPESLEAPDIHTYLHEGFENQPITLVCGDGTKRLREMLDAGEFSGTWIDDMQLPDMACVLGNLMEYGPKSGLFTEGAVPVYLRAPDVSFPKRKARSLAAK